MADGESGLPRRLVLCAGPEELAADLPDVVGGRVELGPDPIDELYGDIVHGPRMGTLP
ncbi:hypothetical protein [Dactylosporangium matsuzakiense]|uniref:Uncharacterized protein n=1 Tax=Dactylosporangium matsuzakiense TaxID=53360 RepID=A0A9W6NMZ0_9ACTN|nr:hypothetical protein [Dactylosporangium matsuzakiense]UWZ43233.1 hypothetical protein Dmats_38005 [Dactylosporangium matsuzakiense]GLL02668.1 hypothetical protein GCM10017581_044100 [Dactylosporangium matsuzakiense]